jgi:hypothetical protein
MRHGLPLVGNYDQVPGLNESFSPERVGIVEGDMILQEWEKI